MSQYELFEKWINNADLIMLSDFDMYVYSHQTQDDNFIFTSIDDRDEDSFIFNKESIEAGGWNEDKTGFTAIDQEGSDLTITCFMRTPLSAEDNMLDV